MLPRCYFLSNEIATDSLILWLECNFPGWIADGAENLIVGIFFFQDLEVCYPNYFI